MSCFQFFLAPISARKINTALNQQVHSGQTNVKSVCFVHRYIKFISITKQHCFQHTVQFTIIHRTDSLIPHTIINSWLIIHTGNGRGLRQYLSDRLIKIRKAKRILIISFLSDLIQTRARAFVS